MEKSKKSKKLLLIDGNAIIHRAYHALPPLTTKKGELVNAVYGFASTLLKALDEFKPDYVAASFDLAGPTFRHKEYKEYKAQREKAPDELYAQIPRVKELVRAFDIPIYEKEGFEADDVIGTLVDKAEKAGEEIETVIVTGDLDALQLVSGRTKTYAMRRGLSDSVLYDEAAVFGRYGLKPEQLVDFKGLRGDPSDNIPGVKGIGEKTAAKLLQDYGTLEGVYEHLGEIKGATKDKLEKGKTDALQSKWLARIVRDVPLDFDFEKARFGSLDRKKIIGLFQDLNFYSLAKRLPGNDTDALIEKEGVKDFKYKVIGEGLGELIQKLSAQKDIALALEVIPEAKHRTQNTKIEGIAFSWKAGRAAYLPWSAKTALELTAFFENAGIKKVGYDIKEDRKVLAGEKIDLKGDGFDVMLGGYMLNPGEDVSLEKMVLAELGEELEVKKSKAGQLPLDMSTPEEKAQRACRRADYILKLKQIQQEKIADISAEQKMKIKLTDLFEKVEIPLVEILAGMETAGVAVNTLILKGISEKMDVRIVNLEKKIHRLAGREFNVNSSRQLAEVLYVDLKLPTGEIKKGKTGFSTAAGELDKLRDKHPIIKEIEEYRELFKLKTTYLDALPEYVREDGRIHARFNQAVTSTGRLSSSDPNLQNIPIRTEMGQLIRTAFEAPPGYVLVAADYSQIDLRVEAHMSGDRKMIEAFHRGDDIHTLTACEVFKVTPSQVTDTLRRRAKTLNFGIIYGVSPFGFARSAGIGPDEAKLFIDAYFERFPDVAEFMKKTKEFARQNGYVETESGRRRYLPEINSPNFQVAAGAERMAINMPIQGLSADIVKMAMVKCDADLRKYSDDADMRMILQIHDEIIWEVKEESADEVAPKIKEIMEGVYKLKVPLAVDIKTGRNWGEL